MESENLYLIQYLSAHIKTEIEDIRSHLPVEFENSYNSLRALDEWLVQFNNNLITFQQVPF